MLHKFSEYIALSYSTYIYIKILDIDKYHSFDNTPYKLYQSGAKSFTFSTKINLDLIGHLVPTDKKRSIPLDYITINKDDLCTIEFSDGNTICIHMYETES